MKITDVIGLKRVITARFNISENITIRSGGNNLENSKLVTELYNKEDNAFEIIVGGMYCI